MPTTDDRPLRLVICFAPADREQKDELVSHLTVLPRIGEVVLLTMDDRGPDRLEIECALRRADAALLLASPEFLASKERRFGSETWLWPRAANSGLPIRIVLLHACPWERHFEFPHAVLPTDGKPLGYCPPMLRDEAFVAIAQEVAHLMSYERSVIDSPRENDVPGHLVGSVSGIFFQTKSVTCGRDDTAQWHVYSNDVSLNHAVLEAVQGKHIIRDQRSTNGTFVNGLPISTFTLRQGDSIELASAGRTSYTTYADWGDAYRARLCHSLRSPTKTFTLHSGPIAAQMPPASIAWGFGIHNRGLEAADEQYANIAIERALRTHHCCTLFLLEVEHLELLVQLRHLDLRRLIFSSIGKALSGSLPDDTFISGAGWTEILVVVPGQHLPSEAEQVARTIAALVPNHADDEHSDHPRIYFRVTLRWAPMSLENARRRERFPTTRWTESPLAPARAHLGVTRAIIAAADDDRRDTECTPVEAKAIEIAKTTPPFPPTAPTPSPSPSAPVSSNLMTTPAALQLVDLGIIVALQQETGELLDLAGDYTPHGDGDMNSYLFTRSTYRCAVTFVGAMGEMEAARITERHIGLFDPESVISIGISGGVHDDLRVGDVYVPTQAVQYIQGGKASPTDDGGFIIRPGADVSRVDDHLHTETIGFKFNHKTAYRQWRDDCRKDFEALLTDPAIRERLIAKDLVRRDVALLAEGHEASGPVVSGASAFSAWIQSHDRNVKAVDMECAAVVRAAEARKHRKRALVIRGISDYGDPRKKELDAIGGGSLRKYAMRNAVRLLWALLDAGTLPHHTR